MRSLTKFPQEVQLELINSLFRLSSYLFFGLVMVIYVIADYYWDKVPDNIMLPWLVASVVLMLFRVVMVKLFYRRKSEQDVMPWGRVYFITSIISGLLWAYVSLFMLDTNDVLGTVLVVTMITGMVAGSMVPLSYLPPTHMVFSLLSLVPLSIVLLYSGQEIIVTVGIVLVVYTFVILMFTMIVSKSVIESVRLRFENIALLEDVKQQKDLAENASIDKSRFLAATSHDLRQPLHALDLYLGALKKTLGDEEQNALLEKARNSSNALTQLLNALMDISRLDAGSITVNKKNIKLSGLINNLFEELAPAAAEKSIKLKALPADVSVQSDPLLLSRILRNLLTNAIKHNDECEITVSAVMQQGYVVVRVADTGKGIQEQELEKIFSEFYQLENPERDRNKGLGLGLAIVKRLCGLLGHVVDVKSAPGEGSEFSIWLELSNEQAEDYDNDVMTENFEELEGLFVFCIDDEYEVRDALRQLLKSWGCEVLIADSEATILDEIRDENYPVPDMILSDYRLRDSKKGTDAIAAVRAFYQTDIAAILITGDTSQQVKDEAKVLNIVTLFKPVESKRLASEMTMLLSH